MYVPCFWPIFFQIVTCSILSLGWCKHVINLFQMANQTTHQNVGFNSCNFPRKECPAGTRAWHPKTCWWGPWRVARTASAGAGAKRDQQLEEIWEMVPRVRTIFASNFCLTLFKLQLATQFDHKPFSYRAWRLQSPNQWDVMWCVSVFHKLQSFSFPSEEMFKSVDILCAPVTLDAAFDAEVRYPAKQMDQTLDSVF